MRTTKIAKRLRVLGLALIALGVSAPLFSEADAAPAGAAKSKKEKGLRDPNNVAGLSEAMEAMVAGNAKYEKNDYAGAIELYEKAIKLQPKHPLAHYLLGEGRLAMDKLAEAEASFKEADDAAGVNSPYKARIVFALADVLEREKKWDDAKAVWTRYVDLAGKVGDGGVFPESGKARVAIVDEVMKQDKAYEIVRQRIAAEKADGGAKK